MLRDNQERFADKADQCELVSGQDQSKGGVQVSGAAMSLEQIKLAALYLQLRLEGKI